MESLDVNRKMYVKMYLGQPKDPQHKVDQDQIVKKSLYSLDNNMQVSKMLSNLSLSIFKDLIIVIVRLVQVTADRKMKSKMQQKVNKIESRLATLTNF